MSKFKNSLKRLKFLKNYLSLVLPVAIAVVAVLLFLPTQLMSAKLKKRISKESISIGRKIDSLKQEAVSSEQWSVERDYQLAYEDDVNAISLLAKQSSQRQLISYKIFPKPKDTSTLIFKEFGQQYRDSIDDLLGTAKAGRCPTAMELSKILHGSSADSSSTNEVKESYGKLKSEVEITIANILCSAKAESALFYAKPESLSGYKFWADYEYIGLNESIEDCWYYQSGHWIIEDVVDTISALNSQHQNVLTSPVKRLMSVSFSRESKGVEDRDVRPAYVYKADDCFVAPFTGRFSDETLDVIHFRVYVIVDAKAVLPFIRELCGTKEHKFSDYLSDGPERVLKHSQITVLESLIRSVDRDEQTHNLYRYGENAVVELQLVCEYI
ncbi:MAG: hypothetical protein ACYST9_01585, partial [Planctomycetota bacterium]